MAYQGGSLFFYVWLGLFSLFISLSVNQHTFCSHALTFCLYRFIHRGYRYGSKCGGKYEGKWLLSLRYIVLYIVFLMLLIDL